MNTGNVPISMALSACAAQPTAISLPAAISVKDILQTAVSQMGFAKTRQKSLIMMGVHSQQQHIGGRCARCRIMGTAGAWMFVQMTRYTNHSAAEGGPDANVG